MQAPPRKLTGLRVGKETEGISRGREEIVGGLPELASGFEKDRNKSDLAAN